MKVPRAIVGFGLLSVLVLSLGCAESNPIPTAAGNEEVAQELRDRFDEAGARLAVSGGGSGAASGTRTGWGTIKGIFRTSGSIDRKALTVDKDLSVCAPGGKQILSEAVVTGPNGELANVLCFLTTKIPADWEHPDYAAVKEGNVEFDQKNCVFLTHVFACRSTQTVILKNSDSASHNTNIAPDRGASQMNAIIPQGASAEYLPGGESPSPFPVTCNIHPWMKAYMITRDNPYFAVSGDDGTFEIKNVPTGVPLSFRVWQETAGYLDRVTVNGQETNWKKGYFDITLEPDQVVTLEVDVEKSALSP